MHQNVSIATINYEIGDMWHDVGKGKIKEVPLRFVNFK